ncbi:unnamed protein product, partial [Bubo scandiacus]
GRVRGLPATVLWRGGVRVSGARAPPASPPPAWLVRDAGRAVAAPVSPSICRRRCCVLSGAW